MRAHTQVVVEGLLTFLCLESRNPSAQSRSAWDRRILCESHPTTRANDSRWHHRTGRPSHGPFCRGLALQSKSLPSSATEQQVEAPTAGELRKWCKLELLLIRTIMKALYTTSACRLAMITPTLRRYLSLIILVWPPLASEFIQAINLFVWRSGHSSRQVPVALGLRWGKKTVQISLLPVPGAFSLFRLLELLWGVRPAITSPALWVVIHPIGTFRLRPINGTTYN